jgi:hypothetical protein
VIGVYFPSFGERCFYSNGGKIKFSVSFFNHRVMEIFFISFFSTSSAPSSYLTLCHVPRLLLSPNLPLSMRTPQPHTLLN